MDSSKTYLAQTDTTVGFLSSNDKKLSFIKKRDTKQKTLQVVDSFKTLNKQTRVPKKFRKFVRRAKLSTFIYPNGFAFRVVDKDSSHHNFVKKHKLLYSTSANITKKDFNEEFAIKNSDVIIYTKNKFSQNISSKIYRLNKNKMIRIR